MGILYQELLIYFGKGISEILLILILASSPMTLLNKQKRCGFIVFRPFWSNFINSIKGANYDFFFFLGTSEYQIRRKERLRKEKNYKTKTKV